MATQTTDLELKIRAVLEGIESVTGFKAELTNTGAAAAKLTDDAQKLDGALSNLADLRQQIEAHQALQERLSGTRDALDSAREKQRALTQQVIESFGPSEKQLKEQELAEKAVVRASTALDKQREVQRARTQAIIESDAPTSRQLEQHDKSTRRLEALERALEVAKQRQEAANKAVAEGSEPSASLTRRHEELTSEVESLTAQVGFETDALQQSEKALRDNGVATDQLDAAASRINQTFADVTAKAKAFADAQANLKFIPHEQLQREAQGLRDSFEVLRSSGKLTSQELAQANLKLQEGLLDLERKTNGWKDSLASAKVEIGAAIAAFAPIAYSVKQAADFESALAGVRKVVDGTDEQFDALTGRIRELGRELPISASGLADIATAGGQLGVPIEKLDQFIELAAKVSVAFNMTAEQAGQAIAKLSNVFGVPIEKVEELGNAINVLGNTTAATEAGILDFLTRVGGSARTFGLTAEATAALGATMIAFGKAPQVAANAVNGLLTRLQTAAVQSDKSREAFAAIGLSAESMGAQIAANPQAALDKFLGTLEQLDGQARAEAVAQILGLEYADDISLLVENIDQYRDALGKANDQQLVSGALGREFAAQAETTKNQYQLLKNVLADITLELGTAFLPAVKAAVIAGKEVAEAIASVVSVAPGLTAVAVTLVSVGAAMSGLRIAAAAAGVAVTGLAGSASTMAAGLVGAGTAASTATAAVTGLGRAMALVPRLMGIGIALAGAEAVISALVNIRNMQREIAEREAATQQALKAGIEEAAQRLAKYSAQAAGMDAALHAVASGAEQLSGAQKRYYAELLAGSEEYLRAQLAIGLREQELHGKTEINLGNVRASLAEVRSAHEALQQSLKRAEPVSVDQWIDPRLLPRLAEIGDKVNELSADDLAKLSEQAAVSFGAVQFELDKVSAAFPHLKGAALDAALALDERFSGLISRKKELGAAVEKLREEQYKRLGIDASEVLTGIDSKAKDLLTTFDSLVNNPGTHPKILTAAYKELLQVLDSPEELEALRLSLAKVQAAGFDGAKAIEEIDKKLQDVKKSGDEAATAVAEAFKRAGIQTREEVAATARQAQADYELISRSGQATSDGLVQAFSRAADAQLKLAAASGEASVTSVAAMLRAQAATDEQRAAVDQLAARYLAKGEAALAAGAAAASGARGASAALDDELSAIDAVEAAYRRRTAARDGKDPVASARDTTPTSGGSASAGAIDERYRKLNAAQRAEVDAYFAEGYEEVLKARRRRDGSLSATGPSIPIAQNQLSAGVRDLITSLLNGKSQPDPTRTVNVNLNIGGQSVSGAYTPREAERLEQLLRELERAQGISIRG